MIVHQDEQTASLSAWIDRALRIVVLLLIVTSLGFAGFYYWDRYYHRSEPLVERQTRHLEGMIREHPADPNPRVSVAGWYLQKGLVEQAIQQLQEALKLSPDHQDALILLGRAYVAQGEDEQAIAHFVRVVELNKESEFAKIDRRMNLVHYELGRIYLQRGEYPRAIEELKAALEVDRTDADACYALAVAYQKQGDHQAAIQKFEQTLRYVPDFMEAYQGLGESYEALGLDDESAYAEAMVAYSLGEYHRAAQELEEVVKSNPDLVRANLGLGLVYEKLGRKEEAIVALQRFVAVYPDDIAARHALGRLEQLK